MTISRMVRVLYIDDSEIDLLLAKRRLGDRMNLTTVSSAEAANAILESEHFDLIVSDVMMPGTDGLRFAVTLAKREINIPVILTSGLRPSISLEEYQGLKNYLGFILKPLTLNHIRQLTERTRIRHFSPDLSLQTND